MERGEKFSENSPTPSTHSQSPHRAPFGPDRRGHLSQPRTARGTAGPVGRRAVNPSEAEPWGPMRCADGTTQRIHCRGPAPLRGGSENRRRGPFINASPPLRLINREKRCQRFPRLVWNGSRTTAIVPFCAWFPKQPFMTEPSPWVGLRGKAQQRRVNPPVCGPRRAVHCGIHGAAELAPGTVATLRR